VGGASPEVLLAHPHPVQVAGDETAGFYRAPKSDQVEAYSWGGITSRAGSRALWLLLLPFALANAAGFMLSGDRRLPRALLRLMALTVTAMAALWVTGIGIDLLAFQCGGQPMCVANHWWLTFFNHPYFSEQPVRRMAVGLILPVVLIGVWRLASQFTRTRYEEAFGTEPVESTDTFAGDLGLQADLSNRQFWHSAAFTTRLASAHFACATSVVVASFSIGTTRLREAAGLDTTLDRLTFSVAIGVAIVAGAVTAMAGWGPGRLAAVSGWVLLGITAVVNLGRLGPAASVGRELPGYSRPALAVGLLAVALAILLMALLVMSGSKTLFPVATTALAMWAMVSLQAGSHVRVADWLGERLPIAGTATIAYSFAYDWFALASLGLVMTLFVTAGVAFLLLRRRASRPEEIERVARLYPDLPADAEGLSWARRVVKARGVASLTDQIGTALLAMLSLILIGALIFYAIRAFVSGSPLDAIGPMPTTWKSWVPAASWIGSMLPLGALVVMYRSFRDPGTRRRVGVLWDVLTFWPRWYHPLAPPPYSARAVPELGIRLQRLTALGSRVVISAHSQGSVMAVASIARIPARIREQLGLLTHGSPLGRLYGNFFPAYFGLDRLRAIGDRLGDRWINLYRATDPIGGPVGIDDREVLDPESATRQPGDPLPKILGHTFYRGRAAEAAVAELAERVDRL
jgi:hypothetical protein